MKTLQIVRRIFGLADSPSNRFHPQTGLGRAYVSRESARLWVEKQEEKSRQRGDNNPFYFSENLEQVTSMPEEVLHDWLIDHDYPPYDRNGPLGWEDWWAVHTLHFTTQQRADLWRVLDRVHFFEIVEVPWIEEARAPSKWVWVVYEISPFRLREALTGVNPRNELLVRLPQGHQWQRIPLVG